MRVGIVGAGSMGAILARHLATLGHQVSIANSRGPESLTAVAAEIGATPVSVVDAAKAGELVIIAIPTKAVADLQHHLRQKPSREGASEGNEGSDRSPDHRRFVGRQGSSASRRRRARLRPVDGGDLDNSWRQQPGTPAYCQDLETAALQRALTEADRSRIADYRAEQEARQRILQKDEVFVSLVQDRR